MYACEAVGASGSTHAAGAPNKRSAPDDLPSSNEDATKMLAGM